MLMDRWGPAKTSGISFAVLTLYPIGLMLGDSTQLAIVSVIYGLCIWGRTWAGRSGRCPVPSPQKVPQYVAIHATLVGPRGAVFQFVGVGIYKFTGGASTWPAGDRGDRVCLGFITDAGPGSRI